MITALKKSNSNKKTFFRHFVRATNSAGWSEANSCDTNIRNLEIWQIIIQIWKNTLYPLKWREFQSSCPEGDNCIEKIKFQQKKFFRHFVRPTKSAGRSEANSCDTNIRNLEIWQIIIKIWKNTSYPLKWREFQSSCPKGDNCIEKIKNSNKKSFSDISCAQQSRPGEAKRIRVIQTYEIWKSDKLS